MLQMPRSRYCKSRSRSRSRSPRSRSRSWDRGRDRDRKDRHERSQRRKSSYRYVQLLYPFHLMQNVSSFESSSVMLQWFLCDSDVIDTIYVSCILPYSSWRLPYLQRLFLNTFLIAYASGVFTICSLVSRQLVSHRYFILRVLKKDSSITYVIGIITSIYFLHRGKQMRLALPTLG